jgi:hypothetical protein
MKRYKPFNFDEAKKSLTLPDSYNSRNKDMNDDTYALRRKVIDLIYYASKVVGEKLPRVDVRITEKSTPEIIKLDYLGAARMGNNIIWIPEDTIKGHYNLHHTVFHELVHAIFNIGHINNDILMSPYYNAKATDKQIDDAFKKYYKMWKQQ